MKFPHRVYADIKPRASKSKRAKLARAKQNAAPVAWSVVEDLAESSFDPYDEKYSAIVQADDDRTTAIARIVCSGFDENSTKFLEELQRRGVNLDEVNECCEHEDRGRRAVPFLRERALEIAPDICDIDPEGLAQAVRDHDFDAAHLVIAKANPAKFFETADPGEIDAVLRYELGERADADDPLDGASIEELATEIKRRARGNRP